MVLLMAHLHLFKIYSEAPVKGVFFFCITCQVFFEKTFSNRKSPIGK